MIVDLSKPRKWSTNFRRRLNTVDDTAVSDHRGGWTQIFGKMASHSKKSGQFGLKSCKVYYGMFGVIIDR